MREDIPTRTIVIHTAGLTEPWSQYVKMTADAVASAGGIIE